MKKIHSILMMLMVMSGLHTAMANEFEANYLSYSINADGTSVTVKGGGYHQLTDVIIPPIVTYNGVTYTVTAIGDEAFSEQTTMTSIAIPNSVKTIGDGAFKSCTGLTTITIPNSVTTLGYSAFSECTNLSSVELSDSIADIDVCTFDKCSSLKSVTIPNSVTTIHLGAFSDCVSLSSVNLGSVVEIGDEAFRNCTSLQNLVLPRTLVRIGPGAFYECTGLTSVTIPNSVSSIGETAFWGCTGMRNVVIPSSVTAIGASAFYNCTGLSRIDSYPDPAKVKMDMWVFSEVEKNSTLHVLPKYLSAYQSADQWCDFYNITADLSENLRGDLNDDGVIDVSDVSILIDMVLGKK